MKGFIFGFQRFVWCPKCTPASNNSGTNSVISAIAKSRERDLPERDAEDAISRARAQPEIRPSHCVDFGDRARRFLWLNRYPCPFAEPNVKNQQQRQR